MQAVDLWVEGPSLSNTWVGIRAVSVLCHNHHSEKMGGGTGSGDVACRGIVVAGGGDGGVVTVTVVVVVVVVTVDVVVMGNRRRW